MVSFLVSPVSCCSLYQVLYSKIWRDSLCESGWRYTAARQRTRHNQCGPGTCTVAAMANEAGNDAVIQRKSAQETPLSATTHSVNSLRDVEGPDDGVFDSNSSKYISQNYRRAAGAAYVLSMGVCGIVLVALASSLKSLAIDVDKTSIQASSKPEYDVMGTTAAVVRWFLFLSSFCLHPAPSPSISTASCSYEYRTFVRDCTRTLSSNRALWRCIQQYLPPVRVCVAYLVSVLDQRDPSARESR